MARYIICVMAIFLMARFVKAQNSVGVNTDAPNPNAALDIHPVGGQVQGLLIPRISSAERTGMALVNEDNGLMVFDFDFGNLFIWYNGSWLPMAIEGAASVTTDGFTIFGDGHLTPLFVNVGTGADQIVQLDGSGFLPALDGSQLFNLPAASVNTDGFTITGDGDAINLAVNVGTGPDQVVQLDGSGLLPAVDASQLVNLPNAIVNTDGTTVLGDGDATALNVNIGTGPNQIVALDASSRLPGVDGSLLSNLPTTPVNTDGTTVLGDGDATALNVNVGTGANQIVALDGSSRLPGVDASLLTNLPTTPVNTDGTTVLGDGDATALNVNVGTSPNQIVQLDGSGLLPNVDGSQLTGIIADNVTNVSSESAANVASATAQSFDIGIVSHPLITDNQTHLAATLQVGTEVNNLNTLTGVSAGVTDLGIFSNGIITANTNIQTALQDLEDAVNGAALTSGSGITVSGSNINLGGSMTQDANITSNGFAYTIIRGSPTNAATMHVYNNNGSVGTGGNIVFEARNSATNPAIIGKVETKITSTTNGAESGEMVLSVATSGSLTEGLRIDDTGGLNANSYNYNGTETRYYGISPVDFSLIKESSSDDNELGATNGNSVFVSSASEESGAQIAAPVHLPDGAEIVSVEIMGRNTTGINATVHFMAKSYSTATSFDDQVIVPLGTGGITTFNVTLGATRIIDNFNNNYFIYIDIPTSSGATADFTGARITYTVTHAD